MDIKLAITADYANITQEGKLNVLGIFDRIGAFSFPAFHPLMHLIFNWEANRSESGRKKEIEIQLCDGDGKKIFAMNGQFEVPNGLPGKRISGNQIIPLPSIRFEKPDLYVFNILINGEHKAEAPFEVISSKEVQK